MRNWKAIAYNLVFAGNCLLIFLLVAEHLVVIPQWLQVAGRMHPLILHFPVVLVLLAFLWELLVNRRFQQPAGNLIGDVLLLSSGWFAMLTAIMGVILAHEPGYEPDSIFWHKWGGVALSLGCLAWYAYRTAIRHTPVINWGIGLTALFILLVTGHEGATITHGENFLLAPVTPEKKAPKVNIDDAKVYADVIYPILEAKCISCHNTRKAKGELIMETAASLYRGGKSGLLWDSAANDFGLLLQRIHLPLNDKKHMPPSGKLQLTPEEATLLALWVKSGADTAGKFLALAPSDSIRLLAAAQFVGPAQEETYNFAAASESAVNSLNNHYRLVAPIAAGSPALQVDCFGASQFSNTTLTELLPVKQQVVSLTLNKMPATDKDLETIGQFPELRELNLSFTNITDAGLPALLSLKSLKVLSLSGTKVTLAGIRKLASIKSLKELYCWNTEVKDKEYATVHQLFPKVQVYWGFNGDTMLIQLNPPIIENDELILTGPTPLKMKHFVTGVDMRYTLDGQEPDSLRSPKYDGKLVINDAVTLKAKAFKKGWISSTTVSKAFFKSGLKPDSMTFVYAPDPSYKGMGPATLFDAVKGDNNFRSGKWLGFREKPVDLHLQFSSAQQVSSVTLSSLIDIGGYIFPPAEIQVWSGTAKDNLKLVGTLKPRQPSDDKNGSYQTGFTCSFPTQLASHLRLVVKGVNPLPAWHPGKGQKAWVFVDEIFIR